ncbi:MAG: NAD-dependent deacylase [bacterium]|nr:NAD-dependent deacylase [bacterium]
MDNAPLAIKIKEAARLVMNSKKAIALTGAGISVESGIPPFRGPGGLWSKYDPALLDIRYFRQNPEKCWEFIYEIFYRFFRDARPNEAHISLAELEKYGCLKSIITQNIDHLHQEAGSRTVHEFHGNSGTLVCGSCLKKYPAREMIQEKVPPVCPGCQKILKPDFVFFGEPIPEQVLNLSFKEARSSDLLILIGTTGEVYPAARIPVLAKQNHAILIEVNPSESNYTGLVTDLFLQGQAGPVMGLLLKEVLKMKKKPD